MLLEQARFDGGPSYGDGEGNVEKVANLYYNSEIELIGFANGLDVS